MPKPKKPFPKQIRVPKNPKYSTRLNHHSKGPKELAVDWSVDTGIGNISVQIEYSDFDESVLEALQDRIAEVDRYLPNDNNASPDTMVAFMEKSMHALYQLYGETNAAMRDATFIEG